MADGKKRALILAAGGMKVAWQAGVLQVLLDEARLSFDIFQASSSGGFQLAMLCQGMTGTQVADNWRNMHPLAAADWNLAELPKLAFAESLFDLDGFRKNVFPAWGLDFDKIRASGLDAGFDVYNFSKHQLEVIAPKAMSEDLLAAAVSLPMWFPSVLIGGNNYIDPVFNTAANLEEAIRRGADELWVIWTISQANRWNAGFVNNYFQIVEASANGHYNALLNRIAASNVLIAAGKPGEFGRLVDVKEIKGEVPLNYLIDLSSDRFKEAVNLGVTAGRSWCVQAGIDLGTPAPGTPDHTRLTFTEEMKGFVTRGETDFDKGFRRGQQAHTDLMFHLDVVVAGVHDFVTNEGTTSAATGWVKSADFGGQLPVEQGWFNLFVDSSTPTLKHMLYRLFFTDGSGKPMTLSGFKILNDGPGANFWHDTTTLFTHIFEGHVMQDGEAGATVIATGIIHLHMLDFLHQLTTFRVDAPTDLERASALSRFGVFFFGGLWDVYGSKIVEYGPW
jgi:predicted patatin/cPLA2 family phospholipase